MDLFPYRNVALPAVSTVSYARPSLDVDGTGQNRARHAWAVAPLSAAQFGGHKGATLEPQPFEFERADWTEDRAKTS